MKSIKDILNDFINKFAETNEFYLTRATVKSIDTEKNTCICETIDDKSEIVKVQFSSYINAKLGVFIIPKLQSVVTLSFYNKNEACIVKTSVLGSLKFVFEDDQQNEISFFMDENGIVFNGGLLGGLVKVAEMTERFNDLESLHNTLQSNISSWTPVPNDGGAAFKTILSSGYGIETVPDSQESDFENDEITQ